MRVVADTNTVISGLFWHGPSRQVLDTARQGVIELYTSPALLAELDEVIRRDKFTKRLSLAQVTPRSLVQGYAALAQVIEPAPIESVVLADADDDAVIACAVQAKADIIVSGDRHLLNLKDYDGITILTASDFLQNLSS